VAKGKFRSLARNSAARGKLWALLGLFISNIIVCINEVTVHGAGLVDDHLSIVDVEVLYMCSVPGARACLMLSLDLTC